MLTVLDAYVVAVALCAIRGAARFRNRGLRPLEDYRVLVERENDRGLQIVVRRSGEGFARAVLPDRWR